MFKKWFGFSKEKEDEKEILEIDDDKEISEAEEEKKISEIHDENEITEIDDDTKITITDIEKEKFEIDDKKTEDVNATELRNQNNQLEIKDDEVDYEKIDGEDGETETKELKKEKSKDGETKIEELDNVETNEKKAENEQFDNVESEEDNKKKKVGFFERLKRGLKKTTEGISYKIDDILGTYTKIDDDMLEEIEEILIMADIGVNTTMEIIDKLKENIRRKSIDDPKMVKSELKAIIREMLESENSSLMDIKTPAVIVVVGVNGVGKTTTIGKLASKYKARNKKVLLAAADTFRAAASEQLAVWADRNNVDIVKHGEGADPGAVVFDAIQAAKARNVDVLICDTAGRLHNKTNLMKELSKIFKIIDREYQDAHRETLLVVDATTGQNAVMQAKTFKETADITGIALTKLDGTAKGGVVIAVKQEVDVPVKLIGVGEGIDDLQEFEAESFTEALFGEK